MDPTIGVSPIPEPGKEAHAPPAAPASRGRGRAMIAAGALVTALLVGGVTSVFAASPSPTPSGGSSGSSPAPSHVCDHAPASSSPGSSSSG